MKKLLSIEWLKLKDYNPFKVLSVFFVFGIVLVNIIVYQVNKKIIEESLPNGKMFSFHPYDFTNTWQTTSYATGFLLFLPAMLLIILITNEYAYKTSRQNIIDGWSRKEFISVKLALALIFAFVTTVIVFLTALSFGFISGSGFSTHKISHVFYFFLKALSYNVLAVFISVWVRKTGFAIGLYFIYMGAENIISQIFEIFYEIDFGYTKYKNFKSIILEIISERITVLNKDVLMAHIAQLIEHSNPKSTKESVFY